MSRLEALRVHLGEELVKTTERENQLRVELEQLYASALVESQKHLSTIASIGEEQLAKRKPVAGLMEQVRAVADTASSLSDKVRLIDTTLKNLREAKVFVKGLDELTDVDKRIEAALDEDNINSASQIVASVHRFEKAGFGSAIDPGAMKRYRAFEARLQDAIKHELEIAIREKQPQKDIENLTRTMYSIGMESAAVGMYFDFLRGAFSERCYVHTSSVSSAGPNMERPIHVEAVTNIFLEVADAIQRHQKFVEEEFGLDRFTSFLSHIEYEANAHCGRVIRALMKTTSVAQSQMSQDSAAAVLDMCLEELVTVVMRCKRFETYMLTLKGGGSIDAGSPRQSEAATGSLQQLIEEVSGTYVSGEQALVTSLFSRAIADDSVDTQDGHATWSSIVDDSFYIFKKAFDRALLTADSNCACAVVNNISNIIQLDLKQFLEESFEASKKLFVPYCSGGLVRGAHVLEPLFKLRQDESGPGINRIVRSADSLPHALSNISMTSVYVTRFKADCLDGYDRGMSKRSEKRAMFQQCLGAFDSVVGELGELHQNSLKYLLQQMRNVFITPFVSAIENVDFDINEEGFGEMQVNDPFMKAFIASLDTVVSWSQAALALDSANPFLSLLCDYLALRLERSIMQSRSRFSLLGATQLYQDVARLVTFFSETTEVPVKLKFGRLQELCAILCLESLAEFRQIYGDGQALLTHKISNKDARSILGLRSEFSHDAIAATII